MNGFFESDTRQTRPPLDLLPSCGKCGLHKHCQSPKMPVSGKGRRGVLIVGEAPGKDEDDQNKQFVGITGRRLRRTLESLSVDPDRDCWFTNSIVCRPEKNRLPLTAIDHCRPNLFKTIRELQPRTVILLGTAAVRSLIGWLWRDDPGGVTRWAGWRIPSHLNSWICPTFHPSYLEREENSLLDMIWAKHLQRALAKKEHPWDKVPDYASQVRCIYDQDEAEDAIVAFDGSRCVAFDYETDRLKPDGKDAQIVSCSVSDGITTIAFPWVGKAVRAMGLLLRDKQVPKIAANLKFEERWTRAEFGFGVRGWLWDTVVAAHVIDNRPRIGSLKFQAFVHLGQEGYDSHVRPMLKSDKGGNSVNRIQDIPKNELLIYNGLDSLLEVLVAEKQRRILGVSK